MRFFFIIVTFIFLPFLSEAQFYYGLQTDFGKSRVQYKEFSWTSYQFQEFDTYYYRGGKPLAEYTATTAHIQLQKIEKLIFLVGLFETANFYGNLPVDPVIYSIFL